MPEGHTIHRMAKDHAKWLSGQVLRVSSPQGRFDEGASRVDGKKLLATEAAGKHLFYVFESDLRIHVHLGLYGKFRRWRAADTEPRGQVRMRLAGDDGGVDLNGPTCCEVLNPAGAEEVRGRLGPDPLRKDGTAEEFIRRVRRTRSAIGAVLLNQAVIAGLGNIYRTDVLYRLGIHPEQTAVDLTEEQLNAIWDESVSLLRIGVRYNRIITVDRDQVTRPFSRLSSSERLLIYKRQQCPRGHDVRRWQLGGRTVFACDVCQQRES